MGREYTIPDSFIRLDATATDADKCVNIRDMEVFKRNFNILIARRIRQPLLTMAAHDLAPASDTAEPGFSFCYGIDQMDPYDPQNPPIVHCEVFVPTHCRGATIEVRAKQTDNTNDCTLYGSVVHPSLAFDNLYESVDVTSTSYATYEITVPVARSYEQNKPNVFMLYATTPAYGADIITNDPISEAGLGWVQGVPAGGAASAGDMIYFNDSGGTLLADVPPRVITDINAIGGGKYRYSLDRRLDKLPVAGSDQLSTKAINSLTISTISVSANAFTEF